MELISTGTVIGQFMVGIMDGAVLTQAPNGVPAKGFVEFSNPVPYLPLPSASPNPVTMLSVPVIGLFDDEGYLCAPDVLNPERAGRRGVPLFANDDPNSSVKNWTWTVTYHFSSMRGVTPFIEPHSLALLSGAEVDLTTVVKVPSSPGLGTDQARALLALAEAAATDAALSASGATAIALQVKADADAGVFDGKPGPAGPNTIPTDEFNAALVSDPASLTAVAVDSAIGNKVAGKQDMASLDADVKEKILDPDSATNAALSAAYAPDNGGKPVGKGELVFNVRDYGAVGDGIADDTGAVQFAMNAVGAAGGGTLFFPPGEYYFKTHVVLVSNVTITGKDAVIRKIGSSFSYVCFASFSGANKGYGSGANNVTVHDLTFRGSFDDASPRGLCAFSLHHSRNFVAYNLRFTECAGQGHQFDLNGCDTITIRDSLFEGFRTEWGLLYNESIQIDNSMRVSSSIADDDASYDGLPTKNVTVDNCKFMPLTMGAKTYPAPIAVGSHGIVEGTYYTNINVLNCTIHTTFVDTTSPNPGALHFYGVDGLTIANNTIIAGPDAPNCRVIYMPRSNIVQEASAVAAPGGSTVTTEFARVPRNVRIVNNTFKGFKAAVDSLPLISIYGGPSSTKSVNIQISGNTFDECNSLNASGNGQTGILVEYADNVEISSNKAYQLRRLVEVRKTSTTRVNDNQVTGSVGSQVINAIDPAGTLIIQNNQLTGFRSTAIQVIPTTTAYHIRIQGNQLVSGGPNHQVGGRWIDVRNFKNVIISDNVLSLFSATVTYGIQVQTAVTGMIRNNIIVGFGSSVNASTDSTVVTEGNI